MVHDAGPAKGRLERLRLRFPDADAVVFGHSHIPLHEERDGFQIFNPGSATDRRRQPRHTIGHRRGQPPGGPLPPRRPGLRATRTQSAPTNPRPSATAAGTPTISRSGAMPSSTTASRSSR